MNVKFIKDYKNLNYVELNLRILENYLYENKKEITFAEREKLMLISQYLKTKLIRKVEREFKKLEGALLDVSVNEVKKYLKIKPRLNDFKRQIFVDWLIQQKKENTYLVERLAGKNFEYKNDKVSLLNLAYKHITTQRYKRVNNKYGYIFAIDLLNAMKEICHKISDEGNGRQ